jgi:SNF2 family DNA or RNA helicase
VAGINRARSAKRRGPLLLRLLLARRLSRLSPPAQLSMKAAHLGPLPSVSSSLSADLRFAPTDQLLRIPRIVSALSETDVPPLVARTTSIDASLPSRVEESPCTVSIPAPSVTPRLAVFLPHFRVEGRHYGDAERQLSLIPGQSSQRKSADAHRKPAGVAINKWDALWPLLQPPLNFAFPETLDLPSDLRPYQIDGIRFLADNGAALLGDEMGTGKTVQAIVALRILFQKGRVRRALSCVPSPSCPHGSAT